MNSRGIARILVALATVISLPVSAVSQQSIAILHNDDIARLADAGLSADTIIAKIRKSPTQFDLDAKPLAELARRGVPDAVIREMILRQTSSAPVVAIEPLLLQEVGIVRQDAIFGCKGRLEASPDHLSWIDFRDCWTSSTETTRLGDVEVLTFESFFTGTSLSMTTKAHKDTTQLSMTTNQAKKLIKYLMQYAPQLRQQCLLSGFDSGFNKQSRAVNCDAWSVQ